MSETPVALHEAAYERYLAYAMSVITSRALPDVRDGLKPVQRRILYTMWAVQGLEASGRYAKCASVVGDVMGKFHPHGDNSIYDALVRMAQPFSLRATLVDGQGNFGSIDDDPPAAMRYTECKLTAIAQKLLEELDQDTVAFKPTYDSQRTEPVVLPAQFPQLLVNGVEGIAVGMATKIPPHNLGEIAKACALLIDDPETSIRDLLKIVKGPDFPTGGQLMATKEELLDLYSNGHGSVRVQATWHVEKDGRRRLLVIDAIPYAIDKSKIVAKIGAEVENKKLPQVVDIRDESTDDVRIVMDLKQDASAEQVVAWLFRHTDLQTTFAVNMTVLVPVPGKPLVCVPERIDLKTCLRHWLDFRRDTIRRRFAYALRELRHRIHVLDGFRIVFADIDEVVRIIRRSEGKRDAAEKLMAKFPLDESQTEAILELKLYRLAKLEIGLILEELAEKRERAAEIEGVLSSDAAIWSVVKDELASLVSLFGDARRTKVGAVEQISYDADAYIVKEDAFVVISKDGWIKRQSSFNTIDKIRVKDGDSVEWLIRAHTRSTITVFGDLGGAYTVRVDDIPATTGHGEPVQRQFKFDDGERVIGVISHDSRNRPATAQESLPIAGAAVEDAPPPPPWAFAITRGGRVMRFATSAHEEPSTKNGRRYAKLDDGDRVLLVVASQGDERVCIASKRGNALVFPISEVGVLRASGKGVTGIKLDDDDTVFACELNLDAAAPLVVADDSGDEYRVAEGPMRLGGRGDRGRKFFRRGEFVEWRSKKPGVQVGDAANNPPLPPTVGDA